MLGWITKKFSIEILGILQRAFVINIVLKADPIDHQHIWNYLIDPYNPRDYYKEVS